MTAVRASQRTVTDPSDLVPLPAPQEDGDGLAEMDEGQEEAEQAEQEEEEESDDELPVGVVGEASEATMGAVAGGSSDYSENDHDGGLWV